MSHSPTSVANFRAAAAAPTVATSRALDVNGHAKPAASNIVIATISRLVGDTGVQTHTRSLNEGLLAAGATSIVQTPFSARAWWLPIFGIRRIFGPLNRSWSTRWYRRWHASALNDALGRLVARQGADAVLAQCPVSAAVALDVRKRLNLDFPVVLVCHFNFSEAQEYRDKGELADEASYQAILDFEQRVLGEVDRVVYVSGWAKRVVENERGIKVRESSIIWNGIAADADASPTPRRDMGMAHDDLVLINVGTLEKRKNQAGLIDLFAEIAGDWPKARLVLVGDGPERGEVRRRIEHHNLASKVRMLGMRRDVPALLASADLYLHYSMLENCPVVLIEAARASLPLAAVPAGGVPELLEALGGFPIDATSAAISLDTLRPLLGNAAVRRDAGKASRAAFERAFTRKAMAAAYLEAMQPPTAAPGQAEP